MDRLPARIPNARDFGVIDYLLNDVLDLESGRRHWSKRDRAVARGDLPVTVAISVGSVGILTSIALADAINRCRASSPAWHC